MIKIEDLFFRDHYDFGTKIGVFYLFGPTNIFDEPKWPSDQKRLDAPGLKESRLFFRKNILKNSIYFSINLQPHRDESGFYDVSVS